MFFLEQLRVTLSWSDCEERTKTKENSVTCCDICGYVAKRKSHYQRHMNERHNPNAIKFCCQFCTFGSKRKDKLYLHLRTMHSGERPEPKPPAKRGRKPKNFDFNPTTLQFLHPLAPKTTEQSVIPS